MTKRLTLAACLLLAACGDAEPEQNVSIEVPAPATPSPQPSPEPTPSSEPTPTPTPTATPEADETAAATGVVDAIPQPWRGTWSGGRGSCDRGSELRLVVGADRLTFYESEGEANRIERLTEREVQVDLTMTGEGETWNRRVTLSLSDDRQRLTRSEAGMPAVTYTKCRT